MNNSCWGSTLQFRIKSNYTSNTTANTTGACYNGTAWVNLWETSSNQNYRLFNEEAMWWNMSNSYGNLVNGTDYNVSGNTLYLNLDHAYRFTNFVLGPNTTLTTTTPNGTVMIILANGTLSVSGTINLTGKGNWTAANYTYGFRTFSAKSAGTFGKGGNGGTTGTYLSCIGGVGGTGNGINGTGGASVGSCAMSDYSCINGNSGGPSAGGSGVASTFGGGVCSGIASGAGANAFGANGADGTVSGSPYARLAAAGGGGAGGIPGVSGASVYLSADVLIVNGSIFTNGLPGMAGGNGGNGAWKYGSEFTVSGGDGGNGGDGGKGGDVYFDYRTATLSGSSNISGASGGLGGIGGTGAGMTETPSGNNGTAGAVGTSGAATYTQLGSSAFCYYNSTWNSIFQIPQAQNMPSLFEEGIYWTLAAQSGQGNLWCWADFNNPNPHGQSFNISINGNRYG